MASQELDEPVDSLKGVVEAVNKMFWKTRIKKETTHFCRFHVGRSHANSVTLV